MSAIVGSAALSVASAPMTAAAPVAASVPLPVGAYYPSVLGTSVGTLQFLLAGEGYATATYLPGYAEYAEIPYNANLESPQAGYFYAAVSLLAGVQYDFDLSSYDYSYRQGATALTPYLDLYDSAGNLLTTTPWTTDGSGNLKGYAGIAFKATTAGTYYIQIAFTGTQTDTYSYFDLRGVATSTGTPPPAPTGAPPVISPVSTSVQASFDKLFTPAQLFTASDPDAGAAITQYEFTVTASAGGEGYFENNSVIQPDGTPFIVTGNDLGRIFYLAGYGAATVSIRAGDGSVVSPHWGAWSSITVTAPTDPAPTVTAPSITLPRATTSEAFASLFSVSDPNGVATADLNYDISYSGTGGTLELAGVAQPKGSVLSMNDSSSGSNIFAGLSSLTYVPSAAGGTDTITLTVLDGYSAGTTVTFTVTAPSSTISAPKLATKSTTLSGSAFFATFSSLITATDPNGVSPSDLTYTLSYSGTGGTLGIAGSPEAQAANLTLSASQLSTLGYTPSLYGGVDQFTLTVSDGLATSAKSTFTITSPSSPGPVFLAVSATVSVARDQITSNLVPTLWTETDAYQNATIAQYEFFVTNASSGVGGLLSNGSPVANGMPLVVSAANLDTVSYQSISGTEIVYVRANDGTATNPHWGAWAGVTVRAPAATSGAVFTPNSATVAATRNEVFLTTDTSSPLSLFAATDPTGGTITQYEFYDNDMLGGLGDFQFNGNVLKNDTVELVSAADLSALSYTAIAGTQVIDIRANDGTVAHPVWGAWASITVTAPVAAVTPNSATVTATRDQIYSTTTASNPLSLFALAGVSSDAIVQYEFFDNDTDGGLGNLLMNGALLPDDVVQVVGAGSLDALTYESIAGSQVISVRANDGTLAHPVWGAWASITVTAPSATIGVVFTPTNATITPQRNQVYSTTDASNPLTLFSVADSTGGTILQYEFFVNDKAGGVGYLLTSNGGLPNDTVELVSAANLDTISYKAVAGTETISIRANDGTAAHPVWGAWSTVTVRAPTEVPNTITPVTLFVTPTTAASGPINIGPTLVQNVSGPNQPIEYEFDYASQASGDPLIPVTLQYNGKANGLFYATDLSKVTLISTVLSGKPDTTVAIIDVRVFDGAAWSNWAADKLTLVPIGTTITTSFPAPLTAAAQSVVSPASLLSSAGQQPSALLGITHH